MSESKLIPTAPTLWFVKSSSFQRKCDQEVLSEKIYSKDGLRFLREDGTDIDIDIFIQRRDFFTGEPSFITIIKEKQKRETEYIKTFLIYDLACIVVMYTFEPVIDYFGRCKCYQCGELISEFRRKETIEFLKEREIVHERRRRIS